MRRILLAALFLTPLLPDFGLFTNADSPKWALLVALAIPALAIVGRRAIRRRDKVRVALGDHLAILAALTLLALVAAPKSPELRATVRAWGFVGTLTALGLLATRYLRDDDRATGALKAATLAAAAASAIGLAQRFAFHAVPASTLGNPSFAAEFVAPCALLLPALATRRRFVVPVLGGLILVAFLVVAKSRADWLGLAVGAAVFALLSVVPRLPRRPPSWFLAGLLLAGTAALPYALAPGRLPLLGRSDTVAIRAHVRDGAWRMAADHPFLGVGLDGFRAHYPLYRAPEEAELSLRREVTFPHNLPAQAACETGFAGLAILAILLFVPVWSGFFAAVRKPEDRITRSAAAAVAAILVSAQFSDPLRHPASALLFFMLTGLLVVRRPKRLVEDVSGRYRRFWPVLLLFIPAATAALVLPSHLVADARLKTARDRLAAAGGAVDAEAVRLLEASFRAEETPDPLRILAFADTVSGRPGDALSRLQKLFRLSPHDELGRIEKARALLKLNRPAEAAPLLTDLVAKRPGDDIVLVLSLIARSAADPEGALAAALDILKSAPVGKVSALAGQIDSALPAFSLAIVRAAERLGARDPDRALAILGAMEGGEARYHAAVVLAAGGRLDAAMDALRDAIRAGAGDRERLASDPRLDPLRARADFVSLLK